MVWGLVFSLFRVRELPMFMGIDLRASSQSPLEKLFPAYLW